MWHIYLNILRRQDEKLSVIGLQQKSNNLEYLEFIKDASVMALFEH